MPKPGPEPTWRYTQDDSWKGDPKWNGAASTARGADGTSQEMLDLAWLQLLLLHTPFRAADHDEYRWLIDSLRDIERLFLADGTLDDYYRECFAHPAAQADSDVAADVDRDNEKLAHVVMLQAQLMEDVFFVLALDRCANAPDNRGWMNLFRRWGNSPTFREKFEAIRGTFATKFVDFFDLYVSELEPIDCAPVPHPWDPEDRRKDLRGPVTARPECEPKSSAAPGASPASVRRDRIPGVYLDSGIREAAPWKPPPQTTGGGEGGVKQDNPIAGTTQPDAGHSGNGGGTQKAPE